jgi:hypothetical protein
VSRNDDLKKKRGEMKLYQTKAIIRLFTGKIGLTDDQAKRRAGCLSKIGDNIYEINREVMFKAGEVIGLESAPKPHEKALECLEPEKPEEPAIELEIKEKVEVAAKPVAKKRRGRPARSKG